MQELDTYAIVGLFYLYRVLLSFLTVMMWSSMGKRYPWQHNKLAKWTASRSWQNWKFDWSHEIQSAPKSRKVKLEHMYLLLIISIFPYFLFTYIQYHYYLLNATNLLLMINLQLFCFQWLEIINLHHDGKVNNFRKINKNLARSRKV